MPTYDYVCPACGPFDALRSLAQRNDPCFCRTCGAASARAWVGAPHPAGCGCCAGAKRGATVTAQDGSKAFPSKRPWMISH